METKPQKPGSREGRIGLGVALTIIGSWAALLFVLLAQPFATWPLWTVPLLIALQTFLYTGLFITAHDAMHGVVFPQNRKLNDAIGALAVGLYALFSYRKLHDKHWEHHGHPASEDDPDFHDGEHQHPAAWYLHFMLKYMSWVQLAGLAIVFNLLLHAAGVALLNLVLFWTIPSLLSTVQLFYFGTYLPHRNDIGDFHDHHNARSNDFSPFWSFLTCYHFGYHWEHHAYPYVPWWRLPAARRLVQQTLEH